MTSKCCFRVRRVAVRGAGVGLAVLATSVALVASVLVVGVAAAPAGATPVTVTHAYVANLGTDTVSVIDNATKAVIDTISLGNQSTVCCVAYVAVSPDGTRAYAVNLDAATVSVIDTATNSVTTTIPVTAGPFEVAFSPDGTRAYVTSAPEGGIPGTVSVIDTATKTVTATIAVGPVPFGLVITPDGTRAYVANNQASSVSVIDTATNTVIATITGTPGSPGLGGPTGLAVTPNGDRVYVADQGDNAVSVIDTATNTVTKTIRVNPQPLALAVTPDGSHVYVSGSFNDTVTVLSTATDTYAGTINLPVDPNTGYDQPAGVAVTPDGSEVYVANEGSPTAMVIDTATNSVTATIPNASGPSFGVAVAAVPVKATPTLSTSASPSVSLGGTISDSATLSGGNSPTGTLIFQAFGPNDPTCARPAAFTSTAPVSGNNTYSSGLLLPGAGSYNFVVSYSGDANNIPLPGTCGTQGETTAVTCTTTLTGNQPGAVHAGTGVTCLVDAKVGGALIVPAGATVDIENSTISGSVVSSSPGGVRMCASTIAGTVNVDRARGFVLIGGDGDDACGANHIAGSLLVTNNTHGLEVIGNHVVGAVQASGNSGAGPLPEDRAPEVSGNGR